MRFNLKNLLSLFLAFLYTVSLFNWSPQQASAGGVPLQSSSVSGSVTSGGGTVMCGGMGCSQIPTFNYTYMGSSGSATWGTFSGTFNVSGNYGYTLRISTSPDNVNWTNYDYYLSTGAGGYGATDYPNIPINYQGYLRIGAGNGSGSGTFTITTVQYAADQQTAQGALDAANAANAAAQNASTQASNAATYANQAVYWLNGTWGGYSLGTIGANAVSANTNASYAATNSANANTNATIAANNASNAYNQAVTTNNYLTDGTNGLTAINSNITTTNTNVTNLANNMQYLIPPVLTKVFGYNGATATTSTSFKVSMNYSGANEYQYQVDGGSWSAWTPISSYTSSGYFTVSVSSTGQHTVNVNLRNNNGAGIVSPVTSGQMTFFKL